MSCRARSHRWFTSTFGHALLAGEAVDASVAHLRRYEGSDGEDRAIIMAVGADGFVSRSDVSAYEVTGVDEDGRCGIGARRARLVSAGCRASRRDTDGSGPAQSGNRASTFVEQPLERRGDLIKNKLAAVERARLPRVHGEQLAGARLHGGAQERGPPRLSLRSARSSQESTSVAVFAPSTLSIQRSRVAMSVHA